MIAGSVHDLLREFPGWNGAKLLVALSQGTPWLLTVRADLPAERGDFDALKGLRLTAAEGPDLVFKTLLAAGGLDPERDVSIVQLPGSEARDVSFGVYAARGLASGQIDGFWSNAMGSATAVSLGVGKVHVDVRRGDDPAEVRYCTFAGLGPRTRLSNGSPSRRRRPCGPSSRRRRRYARIPRRPPGWVKGYFRRTRPSSSPASWSGTWRSYEPAISEEAVTKLNAFAQSVGHLPGPVPYEQVAAVRFRELWEG